MNISPSMMKKLMKQINAEEIPATEVIIKTSSHDLIIKNPQVIKTKAMGIESYQVSGEAKIIPSEPKITKEDIDLVIEQTGCSEEEAEDMLKKTNGDIAEAIIKIKGE